MSIQSEGLDIAYSTTSGGIYTAIPDVVSFPPPGEEVAAVDKTVLKSALKKRRPGKIPDFGELELTLLHDPNNTTIADIRTKLRAGTGLFFKVTYPDTFTTKAVDAFEGFFRSYKPEEAEDEKEQAAKLVIVLTSAITTTPGS